MTSWVPPFTPAIYCTPCYTPPPVLLLITTVVQSWAISEDDDDEQMYAMTVAANKGAVAEAEGPSTRIHVATIIFW